MPSPFPGLDPFVEAQDRWHSFHAAFIGVCSERLNGQLPADYHSTFEERILREATEPDTPDTRRIAHRFGPDVDRTTYMANRTDTLRHGVNNMVDLDPLLEGQQLPLLDLLPSADYHAFVTRSRIPEKCEVYSGSVRDVLPAIAIPLKEADRDVPLDLQAAFTHVYDPNRYPLMIRYSQPIPEALGQSDREWIAEFLGT
jgi:hypothetical protein